ncbi:hypothetical protein [Micromonospora cathayae]|uniref:Spore-associated protein A n=1 Tax=Micromonospora cathayae TaxID=3028804 RepID=A0ABY7ZSI8_9ACTN|nr:hypothetical protein [Micromonospora sp. HUAS 3]WDZ86001.1 hypothetical protein PVK37_06125 [Micromonospora sp. HUAS 3]
MSGKLKKIVVGAATTAAVAAGLTTLTPGAAQAAPYNGACGSSYGVIDAMSLVGRGTVYLTYSGSTGKNCVVTVRDNPGTRLPMSASVSLAGAPWITDSGNYTTYAGPVYVSAPGRCIDWGGSINGLGSYQYNVHCG